MSGARASAMSGCAEPSLSPSTGRRSSEKILRGGQQPAYSFTPPGLAGYAPDPDQKENRAEALRLLAEAGHAGGRGLPAWELLYNNSETHREIAEALQEMWRRDLGVSVRLVNEELKSTEEARRTGAFDLLRSSWIADYADPSAFLEIWRGDSGNNFTGWSNAEYDRLLATAERTADPPARNAAFAGAERLLLRQAPIIVLYHYTHVFLIRPSVHGWNPTCSTTIPTRTSGWATEGRRARPATSGPPRPGKAGGQNG